ncbi:unnamed protein product [Paramecium pentaurelia]|uniref:Aldehyde dehydrogenase n=1 Tax=Paramecium pentaurelia TaxID=43138 RepID=A0A8S1X2V9_9CILI|nr:unnamed protein product [Paramecium pentaurelia]
MDQIQDNTDVIQPIFQKLKETFSTHKTKCVKFRKAQLRNLIRGLQEMEQEFHTALENDLGVTMFSSQMTSTIITKAEVENQLAHIDEWSKEENVDTPFVIGPGSSKIIYEPLGVVLVIAAWNYPLYTGIPPMAAAIASGNCVILKPSEIAPHSSKVMYDLVTKYLDQSCYAVIQGGVEVSKKITTLPFDLIIFTGSPEKGKLVAKAASENLVPCILELGGKSPTIVDKDCSLNVTAQRIIQGRFTNAGQTCVACDYVFVHQSIKDAFINEMKTELKRFFGENPQNSQDYSKIVTEFHTQRLQELLKDHNGQVVVGGQVNVNQRYVEPTIILQPSVQSKLMTEEIFGPILPVLLFDNIDNVIQFINSRPKPLALYYYGSNSKNKKLLEQQTSSGAIVYNDSVFHLLNPNLPFGGVGNSGYGAYHGVTGFKGCSHAKPVFTKSTLNIYPFNIRYPPFTKHKLQTLSLFFKFAELPQRHVVNATLFVSFLIAMKVAKNKGYLKKFLELSKPYVDKLWKSANL